MIRQAESLRRRVLRLFEASPKGYHSPYRELQSFTSELRSIGEFSLIGGAIRDIYLGGIERFKSDLDFVISSPNHKKFSDFAKAYKGIENRFGGFSIKLKHWNIDIWLLERTWAKEHAGIKVDNFEDLIKTTFFNWDAILFNFATKKMIFRRRYFLDIDERHLEINLLQNPSTLSNTTRALRYCARWDAKVGPKLQNFLLDSLKSIPNERILTYEREKFAARFITREFIKESVVNLEKNYSINSSRYIALTKHVGWKARIAELALNGGPSSRIRSSIQKPVRDES